MVENRGNVGIEYSAGHAIAEQLLYRLGENTAEYRKPAAHRLLYHELRFYELRV